ncbi:MAG TPA: metallophosphoesterase [Thermoplasmatales archaeon]|nr:metallophosphoesterase [Candidatus Thermoplasmatota archaeon]HDS59404.1 metallophosphoesterase [Thermoplasmatales archaeon]
MDWSQVAVVGVMADSHDHLPAIRRAVDLFNSREVDLVVHAGDIVSPFTAREFRHLKAPLLGVFGNNDGDRVHLHQFFSGIGEFHPDPLLVTLGGKDVALTHTPEIVRSLAHTCDVVLYGHTHEQDLAHQPALIVNPGECCGYLTGRQTVALLHLPDMTADIVAL